MHRTFLILLLSLSILSSCGDNNGGNGTNVKQKPPDQALADAFKADHPRVRITADPDEKFVTVATADRAATLDPHNTENGGDVKVINQIYQNLLRVDPADVDKLIPELAESWEVSDDSLAIEFKIREGVKFHDGTNLDASGAKKSLDRLIGNYLEVPAAPYRGFYDFIEEIIADGMTLTIDLKRPVARVALRNLTMFPASIISPKLLDATKGLDAATATTFVSEWASGTGAYFLSKFDSAEGRVRLRAFDGWGGKPTIAKVVFRQVADPNSQIEYLKSGEADMLDDPPRPVWEELEKDEEVTLHTWWALNLCYLAPNVGHEKTKELDVRKAIRLAIDRTKLKDLYYGTARETYSIVAQPLGEYDPEFRADGTEKPLGERVAAAKQMIEEAGAVGRELKIYYPLNPRPYLPTPEKVADKLRQQLNETGLKVEIVAVPNSELFSSIKDGKYELVLIGWMTDNADPDNFYFPLAGGDLAAGKPSPTNVGRAFDKEATEAMVAAQSITDPAKRVEAYRQIERRLQNEIVGYIPLVNTQQGMAFGPRLSGVEVDAMGHYRFHKAVLK